MANNISCFIFTVYNILLYRYIWFDLYDYSDTIT